MVRERVADLLAEKCFRRSVGLGDGGPVPLGVGGQDRAEMLQGYGPCFPGESKSEQVRYLNIYEDDQLDEAQLEAWIGQAAALPGWDGSSTL